MARRTSQTNRVRGSLAQPPQSRIPSGTVTGTLATPTVPEAAIVDDPIKLFKASVRTGLANTEAQIENFNASIASFMGNEEDMQDHLNKAQRIQSAGAFYLANAETFEEFLDEPTFGGFINQAISATGQFVPSAVASIGLAMTGAAIGTGGVAAAAGVGATTAAGRSLGIKFLSKQASKGVLPTSIAQEAGTRAAVQKVVNKYIAIEANKAKKNPIKLKPLTPDEEIMIKNLYAHIRNESKKRGAKIGALVGAGSQEQVMGQGIAFGDYAEQGMTGRDEVFASGLQGLGFAALGLGSEVAVVKSVGKVINKKPKGGKPPTTKDGALYTLDGELVDVTKKGYAADIQSRRSRFAQVAGTTAVAEGIAETGQEELSVRQKLRIDEAYTKDMANLDRANALFAGFFGGMGMGSIIGAPSSVAGKSYDMMKQAHAIAAQKAYELKSRKVTGQVLPESATNLEAQFADMGNPTIERDLVWVVDQSKEAMKSIEAKMQAKYPNMKVVDIAGVGTLYTTNEQKAESFANVMTTNTLDKTILDQWLADNLGYSRSRDSGDAFATTVKDKDGNTVWQQSTTAEGIPAAEQAAIAYINNTPGYTYKSGPLEEVIDERMQDEGLDETDPTEQQESFETAEEELGNIFDVSEPTAVEEGRGSFLDPITPRQKGKQVWQIPSTDITYDQGLVAEARTLVPAEFQSEFDENINKKRYSESLLKAFIAENTNDTTGAFYKINENTDRGGFNLIKYNMGYTPGVTQPSPADITKAVQLAKRNAGSLKDEKNRFIRSRFGIKSPESEKIVPIDMPTLVNQGRILGRRYGEVFSPDEFGSAIEGFGFILASLDTNYELFFDNQPITNETYNDPGAIIYTKNKGKDKFTLGDLQKGRAQQVEQDPTFVDRDTLIGQDYKEKQESLEAQIRDQKAKIEERQKNPITPFTSDTGEAVTQESVLAKMDEKLARLENELESLKEQDQELGSEQPTADQRAEDEFNRRIFKNPYAKGDSTKTGGPKPGVFFSSVVEQHLNATFLKDFQRIANTKLGLKKPYRIFSTTENITAEVLDGDVDLANRVQRALAKMGPESSTRGMNLKGANFDVILVQTREGLSEGAQGARAFTVAHEIGHSFVNQELEFSLNVPALRQGLLDAFNEERKTNDTAQYTNDEQGFKEWMSDQVGSYLLDETKKAQNQTDSFFKRLSNKVKAFVKEFSNFANRRYGVNPAFADYVVELKRINTDPGHFMTKYLAAAEIQETLEKLGDEIPLNDPNAPRKIKQTIDTLIDSGEPLGVGEFLKQVLFAKDDLLRGFGPAGIKLAQMFRGQPQSTEAIGFLTAATTIARGKMTEIQDILGVRKTGEMTQEKMDILLQAEDNTIPTEQLGPQAARIREWLTEHYDSLGLEKIGISKLSNFFPRSLLIEEVAGNPEKKQALVELLMEFNDGLTEQEANEAVEATIADISNEIEIDSDGAKYNIGLIKSRAALYKNVPTKRLRDAELLEDPHRALQKYIDNTVKRVELNKRGGPERIAELLSQIENPKQRAQAEKAVMAMLGKITPISSGLFRGANQIGLAFNVTTLLTFATFASFPDLAGPILRSKDFGALRTATKTIFNMIKDPNEAAKLAKDIGVVGIDAMMETFVGAGELEYTNEKTKKFTNQFFRAIGLEQFTRFTRIFAAGMGKAFLLDNAEKAKKGDKRAIRYLKELGVTADDVIAWGGGDVKQAGNEKIQLALARFVDESIVRPNAAERPIWASDPRFALVWQLKSFFYAYGKTIVGGSINEMQARYTEAGLKGAAVPLFLGAATLLPLTMLGFDLRERFKVGLAWLLPGVSPEDKNYRRSQEMDWGEYTTEIIDRSGVLGPFTLALPLFMEDKRYGDPMWVGPLGPTVEKGYDLFTGQLKVKDLAPVYNNL